MQTSAAEVAATLRERILSGEFAPGSRMHQVQLSEMLGISRTPIREALGHLANQGLLIYEPNRGYQVRGFSIHEIQAAFVVRARLEALACGLAARKGLGAEVLSKLDRCLATGDAILARGTLRKEDLTPYRAMNVAFHDTILREADNVFITDFVRQCYNVPMASDRVFVWEDHALILRSHDDHHRIVEAIRQRDAERADALMREHITCAGQILVRSLSGNKDDDSLAPGNSVAALQSAIPSPGHRVASAQMSG